MKLPRDLSGDEVCRTLRRLGFAVRAANRFARALHSNGI